MVSLVFLLLSIFMPGTPARPAPPPPSDPHTPSSHPRTITPGIEWFGVDKVVLFSDAAENSSLEVESAFHFAALWTRQRIETEIDAVVYHEEAYGW